MDADATLPAHPGHDGPRPAGFDRAPVRLGGMPWTLWRHVAWELFRTFAVTVSIIVTVIAFGAAAKPLAEDAIGADTVLKFVGLAMVPMMQYAMPFAAGLAATLTLHRFATDNEVLAMSAAGMSPRAVLAPVFLLGLPLFGVMLVLVLWTIPQFFTRMQELVTADATQMLLSSVERGEALRADRLMIYADAAREVPAPEGVRRRLALDGVAAIELAPGPAGDVATEFTAERATVDIHSTERGTVAKVVLANASVYRPAEGALITVPLAEPEAAAIHGSFVRGPKFLSIGEILALRRHPERAELVQTVGKTLAARLGDSDLVGCVEPMSRAGTIELEQPGTRRGFRIANVRWTKTQLRPASGSSFTLEERVDGRLVRSATASSGTLRTVSEAGFAPRLALAVATTLTARDEAAGLPGRWPPRVDDLAPAGCPLRTWDTSDVPAMLAEADRRGAAEPALAKAAEQLRAVAVRVSRDADSYVSNRLAQAVSVILVLMLGATLAIAMRSALPLTVYLLAFIPAVVNIIMIAGGRQMMASGSVAGGFAILWGGNAVLAVALWLAWRRVARN